MNVSSPVNPSAYQPLSVSSGSATRTQMLASPPGKGFPREAPITQTILGCTYNFLRKEVHPSANIPLTQKL